MKDKGVLIISLDFELYWGVFDKVNLSDRLTYFDNTRVIVNKLLDLFTQEEIHVTWASVGMLFVKNWEEWDTCKPLELPSYNNKSLSAYFQKGINGKNNLEPYFFAPELIERISKSPYQELASHTYSHFYCNEEGQTVSQFRHDLQSAQRAALKYNINLTSLVFPRNQFNNDYLKVCFEVGILNVRSNPKDWFWNDTVNDKILNKLFRTGDAYIPLSKKTSFKLSSLECELEKPISIPASRFLRPVGNNKFLERFKIKRVINEMTEAAKRNECYHLWWHPHNFGINPEQSLIDLKYIINHFKFLRKHYAMESLTMQEVGSYIRNDKA